MNYDTIADTGFLLAFKVRQGSRAATVAGHAPARDVFRVDARTMGGHQKEVLVTEGTGDEGEILKGTDLAPLPLAFSNARLHGDFVNRALVIARAEGVPISLDNQYYFNGSFFRGTGEGSADAVTVRGFCRDSAR